MRRPRARELGIWPGSLPTGEYNAITDVPGVLVGQVTLTDAAAGVNTGGTAVLPHSGALFDGKVPAAIVVGNGYGVSTLPLSCVLLGRFRSGSGLGG